MGARSGAQEQFHGSAIFFVAMLGAAKHDRHHV
jgi:hypothetical protein